MEYIIKFIIFCVVLFTQISCNAIGDAGYIGNLDNYISGAIEISGEPLQSEYIAKNNFYKKCKEGGSYIGFIESKDIV